MKRILMGTTLAIALTLTACSSEKPRERVDGTPSGVSTETDSGSGSAGTPGDGGSTDTTGGDTSSSAADLVARWQNGPCPDAASVTSATGLDVPEPVDPPAYTETTTGCLWGDSEDLEYFAEVEASAPTIFVGALENPPDHMDPLQFRENAELFQPDGVRNLAEYGPDSFALDNVDEGSGARSCVLMIVESPTRFVVATGTGFPAGINICDPVLDVVELP